MDETEDTDGGNSGDGVPTLRPRPIILTEEQKTLVIEKFLGSRRVVDMESPQNLVEFKTPKNRRAKFFLFKGYSVFILETDYESGVFEIFLQGNFQCQVTGTINSAIIAAKDIIEISITPTPH